MTYYYIMGQLSLEIVEGPFEPFGPRKQGVVSLAGSLEQAREWQAVLLTDWATVRIEERPAKMAGQGQMTSYWVLATDKKM